MRAKPAAVLRIAVSTVVAGIGAAAGFEHTHAAAVAAGQRGWLGWADALVIESMAVVAGLELVSRPARGRARVLPGAVLVGAVLVQMASQVSQAPRNVGGWVYAALPALGCLIIVKFALGGLKASSTPDPRVADRVAHAVVDDEPPLELELPAPVPTTMTPVPAWGHGWPR